MKIKRHLLYLLSVLFSSALALPACSQEHKKNIREQESSKSIDTSRTSQKVSAKPVEKDLGKMVTDLKASMVSYMQTAQPSYTMDDIDSCEKIL